MNHNVTAKTLELKEQKSILSRAILDLRKGKFWESLYYYMSRFRTFHYGLVTTNRRGKIEVGNGSYSSSTVKIAGSGFVKIGKFTSIGSNLSIITGGGHNPKLISTYPFFFKLVKAEGKAEKYEFTLGDVEIGNDVWIGEDVTIMGDVKIGDGVVIGAKSFVPRGSRLKDYGIYAGVPVKLIRYRFSEGMIRRLKKLRWWDLDPETIQNNWEVFYEPTSEAYRKLSRIKAKFKTEKHKYRSRFNF